ncbi:MAG: acylneuraminate cytidylyltransferase family protein [Deltaproteobacteria bacterium]|nr:acylneuraminate cytidylyltransferase family protein [Deltaproteobacteria bacterium]MBW2666499.1 acylneuraminate cytidylyltransferase family protein [Deltaproteobacteria bacterium]
MIGDKRVLAVCPARGGSKGISLKNLKPFRGVPLVASVGQVVAKVPEVDRAVVSTDHDEIARVAEESGLAAPFRRPEKLSGDHVGDLEVLTNALEEMEAIDRVQYDIVLMLQPTSPLRRAEHVRDALAMLGNGGFDAVWTVSETDSKEHPLKQLSVDRDSGRMDYYDADGGKIIARQQLTPVYHRNGVAYAITRSCLLDQRNIKGANTGALVIPGHMVSIDTLWDLELAEYIAQREDPEC